MSGPVELVLSLLPDAKQSATGWIARCPAHKDRTPSLSISEGDDGRALLFCHGGCELATVLLALGLEERHLFPTREPKDVANARIVCAYDYRDESGLVLFQVVRLSPKDFRQRRPNGSGGWSWGVKDVRRVLYRLPELIAADASEPVLIVEGEKDVDHACTSFGVVATCNPGGAGKWRSEHSESLRGRHAVILPDNDPSGEKHAHDVALSLLGAAASVRIVPLPGLPAKGDISDWRGTRKELDQLIADTQEFRTNADSQLTSARSSTSDGPDAFVIHGESIDLADAALTALSAHQLEADDPVYIRGRELVRVVRTGKAPRGITRPTGAPFIEIIPSAALRNSLARVAPWKIAVGSGRNYHEKDAMPPAWLVENIMVRSSWPLRALERVTETPCLRPNGSILAEAGYDEDTGIVLIPNAMYPPLHESPTIEDAHEACCALIDVLQDFPFRDASDQAATLALILSLVARDAIDGQCPLFFVRSPTPGSGKGLLVDVAALIGTGRTCPRMGISDRDDEMRKSILSIALAGVPAVLLDNVTGRFGSRSLAAALTAREWSDRYLGESRNVTAPLSVVWIGTGNNVVFKGDLGRRVLPIDLDPRVEHPEDRQDFAHVDLLEHVRSVRPALVVAALTMLRAYFVAGKPSHGLPRKGSFEAWDDMIRGCLLWCGVGDPDGAKERIRADGDTDLVTLSAILCATVAVFEEREFSARELLSAADTSEALRDALSEWATDSKDRLTATTIGHALRDNRDRIAGGMRFVAAGGGRKGRTWRVEVLATTLRLGGTGE